MFQFFTVLIHIINILTIIYMIFKEKRSANSIIAWTLILYITPIVGFILFLILGRRINKANMFGIKNVEMKIFENYLNQVKDKGQLQEEKSIFKNLDMIMAIEAMDYSPYRDDNEVVIYSDGKELFDELLECLNKAKKV